MRVDIKDDCFKKRVVTLETEQDVAVIKEAIKYCLIHRYDDVNAWHTLDSLLRML